MTTLINLISVNGDFSITRMHVNDTGIVILSGGRRLKTISWTMVARVEPIADPSRIQLRIRAWSVTNKTDLQFGSINDMCWFGSYAERQLSRNKAPIVGESESQFSAQSMSSNQLGIGFSQPQNIRPRIVQQRMMLQANSSSYAGIHDHLDKPQIIFKSKSDSFGLHEFNQWQMRVALTPWIAINSVRFNDTSKALELSLCTGALRKVVFANDDERKNFLVEFNFYKNPAWNRLENFVH